MKKLTFILLVIISNHLYCQDYHSIFLGKNFIQYKGCYLKLKTITPPLIRQFYNNLDNCQSALDNNVIYPYENQKGRTINDSLSNRIFLVEKIIDKNGNDYNQKNGISEESFFVLKDTLSKEIIYFRYNAFNENLFPFYVSNVTFNESIYCKNIKENFDEFSKTKEFDTPMLIDGRYSLVRIYKKIQNKDVTYYLSLTAYGNTPVVDGKDVDIIFTDGTKWTRKCKINVEVNEDDVEYNPYVYSAFIILTNNDLETFSLKKIDKYRLYIFDEDINYVDSEIYKIYFNCLKRKI